FKCVLTTVISALSLLDALPISAAGAVAAGGGGDLGRGGLFRRPHPRRAEVLAEGQPEEDMERHGRRLDRRGAGGCGILGGGAGEDRKSTRLNSSHVKIAYAVFR